MRDGKRVGYIRQTGIRRLFSAPSCRRFRHRVTTNPHDPGAESGNRLACETSPYLLQHAANPVDWFPWGEEALTTARNQDRPILLSIGYSACHWCHAMERESFENAGIATRMNQHYVNIKVDREERPDLDEIYVASVQAMTGSGGWPMTVFLTPEPAALLWRHLFPA
ncbi:MAG: hypothetical protein CME13_10545 [Gemmatimonadetes bacterium]|nr:hypothetical protein [Gemmatimonadota bacterium]